eukprot:1192776-Prorocentrum_minimum.AAC.2
MATSSARNTVGTPGTPVSSVSSVSSSYVAAPTLSSWSIDPSVKIRDPLGNRRLSPVRSGVGSRLTFCTPPPLRVDCSVYGAFLNSLLTPLAVYSPPVSMHSVSIGVAPIRSPASLSSSLGWVSSSVLFSACFIRYLDDHHLPLRPPALSPTCPVVAFTISNPALATPPRSSPRPSALEKPNHTTNSRTKHVRPRRLRASAPPAMHCSHALVVAASASASESTARHGRGTPKEVPATRRGACSAAHPPARDPGILLLDTDTWYP